MAVDESRRAAIVRLLETRYEGLPEPVRRVEAPSGFVHVVTDSRGREANVETCPDCLADDQLRRSFGCETCGGTGRVRSPRARDPYAQSGVVVDRGFGLSRHDETRARDRAIDALDRQLAGPRSEADLIEEANRHPFAWELERRRMYRQFDYAALDRALEQLRSAHPGLPPASEAGLEFLSDRLPDPLRAPGIAAEPKVNGKLERGAGTALRAVRDDEVLDAIRAGEPTAAVADRVGLSVSQVNRIVRRAA